MFIKDNGMRAKDKAKAFTFTKRTADSKFFLLIRVDKC